MGLVRRGFDKIRSIVVVMMILIRSRSRRAALEKRATEERWEEMMRFTNTNRLARKRYSYAYSVS